MLLSQDAPNKMLFSHWERRHQSLSRHEDFNRAPICICSWQGAAPGKSQRQPLDGGPPKPWRVPEQHGHPSPADSSYIHAPPSCCILSRTFVRKYKHSLSSCRVAYPPASRAQTHVKISHRYQTGSCASWNGRRPAASEEEHSTRGMFAVSGEQRMEELKISSNRPRRGAGGDARDKPNMGNLVSFTVPSFTSLTLVHFILPAQSPLEGLLGQRLTQSSSLQSYIKKRQKNPLDKNEAEQDIKRRKTP